MISLKKDEFLNLISNNLNVLKILFPLAILSCNPYTKNHQPNIILIMTDDQGWAQTGYYNHPILETPNLDDMASNGIRFDRFYAAAPVCSPTRASILTGRSNNRTGVPSHGHALRLQEKTIAEALKKAGYLTAHFGKWHLNGLRGPGVPVLKEDTHGPENFGFDHWLTVTNFFDIDPLMSENGAFIDLKGNSSDIIVNKAIEFIEERRGQKLPFFIVIWDGSPHDPFLSSDEDRKKFNDLDENSQNHHGEIVAFDRSLGFLRKKLRDLDLAENTIVWYCSDNGGLSKIKPNPVGYLRGSKGTVYEGGLRVPGIIEWPSVIRPKVTNYPASTMDIFPTIADILRLPEDDLLKPIDGISLKPIFNSKLNKRKKKIPFLFNDKGALIDNNFKLVGTSIEKNEFELFNLKKDPSETQDISNDSPIRFKKMIQEFIEWYNNVKLSIEGKDYSEGKVLKNPKSQFWMKDERYKPFLKEWLERPEYRDRILKGR